MVRVAIALLLVLFLPPAAWAQAKIVRAVMDRRGIPKAAIVAHSWGSSVALALALGAPERVTRIALYDAWVFEDQIPTFFRLARRTGAGELLFGIYYRFHPAIDASRAALIQAWAWSVGTVVLTIGVAAVHMGYEVGDPVAAVGSLIILAGMIHFAVLVFRAAPADRTSPAVLTPAE